MGTARLVDDLTQRLPEAIGLLDALVSCESPSADLPALGRCADLLAEMGGALLGRAPERVVVDGRPHLLWTWGTPRVLVLGHFDTVWPLGTLERWPFRVEDGRATGPGAFDMKAGIVQAFLALAALDDLDGTCLLLTSDEEVGSASSRALIEATARRVASVLVLEPSADGALKTARKGVGMYDVAVRGRAAHAGLDPGAGVNATVELAHHVLALARLAPAISSDGGTTVTPTVVAAGTTGNTVPAEGTLHVDVRSYSPDDLRRVDEALQGLRPVTPGAGVAVEGGINRGPLAPAQSAELFAAARRLWVGLTGDELRGVAVGGASDGNFTAAVGTPTLDGLGAVGGNAHAEGEWVLTSELPRRTALVAALVAAGRRQAVGST